MTALPIPGFPGTGDILGAGAVIRAGATVSGTEYGGFPPPLTGVRFYAPAGSKVHPHGFAVCAPSVIEGGGPESCPKQSIAGPKGSATGVVSFGTERVSETASVQPFFAPGGSLEFFVDGKTPVSLEILGTGHVVGASPPFGLEFFGEVPLIETVPGALDASFENGIISIGAAYRQGKKTISYVTLPKQCPKSGFPAKLEASFLGGATALATDIIPCPRRLCHRHHGNSLMGLPWLAMYAALDTSTAHAGSLPPGPRLPRAVQATLRLWRYAELSDRGHARYGDTFTVRIGGAPTAVLTKDRDAIKRLFTGDPLAKRHSNDLLRTLVGEQSLLVLEPAEHLARRKMLSPPFHGERVQSYARLMERLAAVELDRLRPGEVVAVKPIAQALTLDVILQAVLGISDVSMRTRLRMIFDALNTPLNAFALFVPRLTHRARWNLLSRRPWRLKDELDMLLFEHIAATRADALLSEREDILAMMISARNEDGLGLSDEQLRDELITLIAAGHETTATAIAWGVELLAHNPAVMAKAREADDAYLDALVKEVLRIRSPIPITSARHVLEPFAIGRWTISPEVAVLVDAHGIHHDPDIYPQPYVFRPERFLENAPDGYSFLPFGGGAHRCLGASLALLEIKIVLREMLARFELAPVSISIARPVPRGPTLAPRGGGRVRVVGKRTATREPAAAAAV